MARIIICGTPGTGKSTLCKAIKEHLSSTKFNFINISEFAIEHDCIEEHDDELDTDVIDEDDLLVKIEPQLKDENFLCTIIESIHSDILPEKFIDHVFVCTLKDHANLYDRLVARNYNKKKLDNNIECEIFKEIEEEARAEFGKDRVTLLYCDDESDIEINTREVIKMMDKLVPDNPTIKSYIKDR